MSDYGTYRYMGFWFQPDPVPMDEARPFSNNGFLKKYWDEDYYTEVSNQTSNPFENYFHINFDLNTGCTQTDINFKDSLDNASSINLDNDLQAGQSVINLSENNCSKKIDYIKYFNSIFN